MSKKRFEVQIYYSSFCTYIVDADSEDEAIILARANPIEQNDLLINAENWKEADTATEK